MARSATPDRRFILLALGAIGAVPSAWAAGTEKRRRIGWLVFGGSTLGPADRTLLDELTRRGLVGAGGVEITYRYAGGSVRQLEPVAVELAATNPDLLVGIGGDVVAALRRASSTIAIVGGVSDNPVRAGHAASLARPGRNFTGVTFITDEMAGKRIELLAEIAPGLRRIAVIWNPQHLDDEITFARQSADQLGLVLTSHEVREAPELDAALRSAAAGGAEGLFVIPSRLTAALSPRIAAFAIERRWPAVATWREFAENGALASYGPNRTDQARHLATYVERVLAGTPPGDLPIGQPATFELVVNLKTAAAIGIQVPTGLLDRADTVIE